MDGRQTLPDHHGNKTRHSREKPARKTNSYFNTGKNKASTINNDNSYDNRETENTESSCAGSCVSLPLLPLGQRSYSYLPRKERQGNTNNHSTTGSSSEIPITSDTAYNKPRSVDNLLTQYEAKMPTDLTPHKQVSKRPLHFLPTMKPDEYSTIPCVSRLPKFTRNRMPASWGIPTFSNKRRHTSTLYEQPRLLPPFLCMSQRSTAHYDRLE